jgi:hypothetical protein
MNYKNIKIKFTEFSDFGRISMEISGVTYTVDVESQQHLKSSVK